MFDAETHTGNNQTPWPLSQRWETATPTTVTSLETSHCNHSVKVKLGEQSRQTRHSK